MYLRRRLLSSLLAGVFLALACFQTAFAADTELIIRPPDTLPGAGDVFCVSVDISGNPGLCAVQFTLNFDRSKMTCTDADTGSILSGTLSASNPNGSSGPIIAAASAEAVTGDGTLAEYTFRADADISEFDFTLTGIVLTDAAGSSITGSQSISPTENPPSVPDTPPSVPDTPLVPSAPAETPTAAGTAEALQEEAPSFSDVSADFWGADYIARAAKLGLFNGYPDGTFHPNDNINRADFVTVLWRLSGSPEPKVGSPFADVPSDAYYAKAVAWAKESGYVDGTGPDTFGPSGMLQRQAAMKILFAYSGGSIGAEMMFYQTYESGFNDSADIAPWAKSAMYWGYYNGIISGVGDGYLSPGTGATRAQLAKILVNYIDKFAE